MYSLLENFLARASWSLNASNTVRVYVMAGVAREVKDLIKLINKSSSLIMANLNYGKCDSGSESTWGIPHKHGEQHE